MKQKKVKGDWKARAPDHNEGASLAPDFSYKRGARVSRSGKRPTPGLLSGHQLLGREIEPCIGLHVSGGICLRFSRSLCPNK